MTPPPGQLIHHPSYGDCELLRVEGTDWVIRPLNGAPVVRLTAAQRKGITIRSNPSAIAAPVSGTPPAPPTRPDATEGTVVEHPAYGRCELVRIEGTDWILRPPGGGPLVRLPSSRHFQARVVRGGVAAPVATPSRAQPPDPARVDRHKLLRMFDSLRTGLEPRDAEARLLAVGLDPVLAEMRSFLTAVDGPGGEAMILRGAYGQGKTFNLRVLREMALEQGFLVAQTEVDASENQLDKPHHIYRSLIRNLRIPGEPDAGVSALARAASRAVRGHTWEDLLAHLQCRPLAWLLSDPHFADKPELLKLLACEPGVNTTWARKTHCRPGPNWVNGPRYEWTQLSATTQGDFVSCLCSGLGRLARLMGHSGLVLILDEMEKWQNLNWKAQSRAGNLLGGLIWAATGVEGAREEKDRPRSLMHSARNGGYPFTTTARCHLGLAIALTPRGEFGPEQLWATYGPLREVGLPDLTPLSLVAYVQKLAPLYARAYGLPDPDSAAIAAEARAAWAGIGDGSMRTAVQQALVAFDVWRDRVKSSS